VNPIARVLDGLLAILKWPIAIVALVLAPGLVYASYFVVRGVLSAPSSCVPFAVGAVAVVVLWVALESRRTGAWWTTVEHELTHALFAWATFHRVVGFVAALRSGGHIRYNGRGNWAIAIAPFFFPTLSLAAIVVLTIAPRHPLWVGGFVLGVTVAYHVLSTWSKSLRHHADLRECGWLFSTVFLIAANAFVFGLVIAYACGQRSLTGHLEHVRGPSAAFFRWLVHLLPGN
jgi:hypothetical protein